MKDITQEAIGFDTYYDDSSNPVKEVDRDKIPEFRDFIIKDVYCLGAAAAVLVTGLPNHPVHNVLIENADITAKRGIHLVCAEDITFKNVIVHTPEKAPLSERSVKNIVFKH